ncbi:MAG TPA: universal stress protein [Nitrososphaeraceae archaeon]|nr:universal stress protein [Nitrososphaeraceae archaeon]
MYNKILVPIDGSKPADKALDHAVNLIKSISNNNDNNNIKIQLIILFVIPELPVPLGFEKPMRSLKTGERVSFSDYIKEMHHTMKANALEILSERKKRYESIVSNNFAIKTQVIVGNGLSVSNTIIDFANKEKVDLIVLGNVGLSGVSKVKALGSTSRDIVEKSIYPVLCYLVLV